MPYPGEHSLRLLSPSTAHIRVRRTKGSGDATVQGVKIPTTISIIWFIVKSDGKDVPRAQALRFPTKTWSEAEARAWIRKNKLKGTFEAAKEEDSLFYSYENKSASEIKIALHGPIGFSDEASSQAFFDLLTDDIAKIHIDINSPGGAVTDGLSIYNQLKDHKAEVNVKISGVAASMASVIAMAGDKIEMPETALMMIHKPLIPFLVGANADKLRKQAEALDKMEKSITLAYKSHMNKSEEEIADLLREETWLNADEALELGLADVVTSESVDIMNYFDFEKYGYESVPAAAMAYSIDADDEIEIAGEDKPSSILNKIKQLLFEDNQPLKKEIDMADTAQIDKLTSDLSTATEENKTLKTENQELKNKMAAMEKEKESKAKETRAAKYKAYVEEMVKEGRVRPVDVDNHVETMELKFQASDEKNDKVKEYKDWLKSLPVVVDTSGRHVASKNEAGNQDTEKQLGAAAQKIMAEKKVDYISALREAMRANPELCS